MRTVMRVGLAFAALTAAPATGVIHPQPLTGSVQYDPLADPSAVVVCGAARITVLSALAVRLEVAGAAGNPAWEDRASFAFVNRKVPVSSVPKFTVARTAAGCEVAVRGRPQDLTVTYSHATRCFSARKGGVAWVEGAEPRGNLGGMCDAVNYDREPTQDLRKLPETTGWARPGGGNGTMNCKHGTLGVLSTDGWAVFNDTGNNVFDDSSPSRKEFGWDTSIHAAAGGKDLYLFMYGDDFAGALKAFAAVSGKAVVPPRRFFGVWWSKWEKYDFASFRALAAAFEEAALPVDGLEMDTEWHVNPGTFLDDPHGNASWYSGLFDWDETMYGRKAAAMRQWLADRGLWPVWFDIHPKSGVRKENSAYAAFAAALGVPADEDTKCMKGNLAYDAAFYTLLQNQTVGDTGNEFYWWRDGGCDFYPELNTQFYEGASYWAEASRRGLRPSTWGPFSGVGTQRYPHLHSGDGFTRWSIYEYEVLMTVTGANLGLHYIAHDIGGHRAEGDVGRGDPHDGAYAPELYLRWTQFGVYSAMLRPHPQKYPRAGSLSGTGLVERRYWEFPYATREALSEALRWRSRLVPYSYAAALRTYLTDQPFISPLYVAFGATNATLAFPRQYLFGPSLLVAPITAPMLARNVSAVLVLLPASPTGWAALDGSGCWPGSAHDAVVNFTKTMYETPVFVAGGSMLPTGPERVRLSSPYDAAAPAGGVDPEGLRPPLLGAAKDPSPRTVVWEVFIASAAAGAGELLEDDGDGDAYLAGSIGVTSAFYTLSDNDTTMKLAVAPVVAQGNYAPPQATRNHEFRVHAVLAPKAVTGATSWRWDAAALTLHVLAMHVPVHDGCEVVVTFDAAAPGPRAPLLCSPGMGFPAMARRVRYIKEAVDKDGAHTFPSNALNALDETSDRMHAAPETAAAALEGYGGKLAAAFALHCRGGAGAHQPSAPLCQLMEEWMRDPVLTMTLP